jgi:hypothetical protein
MYFEQVYNTLGASVKSFVEITANRTATGYGVFWASGQEQLSELPIFHDPEGSIGLCKPAYNVGAKTAVSIWKNATL